MPSQLMSPCDWEIQGAGEEPNSYEPISTTSGKPTPVSVVAGSSTIRWLPSRSNGNANAAKKPFPLSMQGEPEKETLDSSGRLL